MNGLLSSVGAILVWVYVFAILYLFIFHFAPMGLVVCCLFRFSIMILPRWGNFISLPKFLFLLPSIRKVDKPIGLFDFH
jgi:hypothetical protein